MLYDILLILYFLGCIFGLWFVFKKAGVAPWKALIPIYHFVVWVKLCGKSRWWYLYLLLPGINIFIFLLLVVETAKIFRRQNFWEQLAAVIVPWIYLPIVGLSQWQYHDPAVEPPLKVSEGRDWLEAIAFALVAAVIIRGNVGEFYNIPSSSMEKSLMTGDYLLVSKLAYGPRVTMTPLAIPLVHNTMPFTKGQCESFLDWIQLPYHRYPGFGKVKRFDAVVFNYPDGDTVCTAWSHDRSYHDVVREMGREATLNAKQLLVYGRMVENHIRVRPVDKRENFIKRCVGLPGEELQIINQQVFINGNAVEQPPQSQQTYAVRFRSDVNIGRLLSRIGVSEEDMTNAYNLMIYTENTHYELPLTTEMAESLKLSDGVLDIQPIVYPEADNSRELFPYADGYHWSVDNFGPLHIPAKGETLPLNLENLPLYRRVIEVYEGNELEIRDGQILINGQVANSYTFKMDYYWMMGDNRHNSVDSRYWGFVPEDHIAGKASLILFSWDKEHHKMRWNRTFRSASKF